MQDVNLTRIMLREDIEAIKRWPAGRFSVALQDGRFGVGRSVGEALEKAKAGAENIRKAS
jgi:hypothetical protein